MKPRFIQRSFWLNPLYLALLALAVFSEVTIAQPVFKELTILVPAERGGGWDLTAKAMAEGLRLSGGAETITIEYSPGAGGLIGLAQFIASKKGEGNAIMVGGMFMVGAVLSNHAAVSLLDTTPLARLTRDNAVVAVSKSSRIETVDGLIEALHSEPELVTWVGGSKGGPDELMLMELARELGIAPGRLHYTPVPGGGEVGAAIARGDFTAGISGYSEFAELVEAGQLRIVAVVTKGGLPDVDAPGLDELGVRILRHNWRGVFAPPGIDASQKIALTNIIERMVSSPEWQDLLDKYHWRDAYMRGDKFVDFVRTEQERAAEEFSFLWNAEQSGLDVIGAVLLRRYTWALILGGISIVLIVVLYYQRQIARHKEEGLQHAFEKATGEASLRAEELEKALAGIHTQIVMAFESWGLSSAEREIALLMLKGLRLKEIASARGTSERTVRQQAQAVYKKAGLEGRSDLAAYFIEDFMESMDFSAENPDGT